jgi:hypothetical protein
MGGTFREFESMRDGYRVLAENFKGWENLGSIGNIKINVKEIWLKYGSEFADMSYVAQVGLQRWDFINAVINLRVTIRVWDFLIG